MSAFKEQVALDIHNVFLNLDEFAEVQELAGKEVPVVSENLEMAQLDSSERDGVGFEGVTLYVSLADVPDRFMPGKKPLIGARNGGCWTPTARICAPSVCIGRGHEQGYRHHRSEF